MKKILCAALVALFLCPAASYAGTKDVVREYTFTTQDPAFSYEENQEIEVDGKAYVAKDIDYEVLKEETQAKEIKTYENLAQRRVPKEISLKDGTKLTLDHAIYTTRNVTEAKVYENYTEQPQVPDQISIKAGTATVTGQRSGVSRAVSASYDTPFTVRGTFYGGPDTTHFVIGGKTIPVDAAPSFSGYQEELLTYLKLDPEIYRIDSGKWTSDWTTSGGQAVRYATYSGMQRSNTYTVTYTGTVYDAKAVYTNGVEKAGTTYTVKATVHYERAGLTTLQKAIIAAAAVVILAGLIACILLLLRKKREKKGGNAA